MKVFWIFFHAAKLLLLENLYHTENLGSLTSVSTASWWQIVAWPWVNKLHLLETVFEQGASWSAWICHQSLPWVQKERPWYLQLLCWGPHSAMSMFCSSSRNPLHLSEKKMKFSWHLREPGLTLGAPSAHAPGQSLGPPLTQHWCPASELQLTNLLPLTRTQTAPTPLKSPPAFAALQLFKIFCSTPMMPTYLLSVSQDVISLGPEVRTLLQLESYLLSIYLSNLDFNFHSNITWFMS